MAEWIYFIHPPREDFAATMTAEEETVWAAHFERFERLLAKGVVILVSPTLGSINTGVAIFEARTRLLRKRSWMSPVLAGDTPTENYDGFGCPCCAAGTEISRSGSTTATWDLCTGGTTGSERLRRRPQFMS